MSGLRGVVLDIETRIDRRALRASGRGAAPRGMPPGLQVVAAGATLAFEVDDRGVCGSFALRSADASASGERGLVRMVDRHLGLVHDGGGVLVSFNGGHDLSILRLAAMRLREFSAAGAARWISPSASGTVHEDLMLGLGNGLDRFPRLGDLAAALGMFAPGVVALGSDATPRALAKCEADVVATMVLYMHVLAERARSPLPLERGLPTLVEALAPRLQGAPHLAALVDGRLFGGVPPP